MDDVSVQAVEMLVNFLYTGSPLQTVQGVSRNDVMCAKTIFHLLCLADKVTQFTPETDKTYNSTAYLMMLAEVILLINGIVCTYSIKFQIYWTSGISICTTA